MSSKEESPPTSITRGQFRGGYGPNSMRNVELETKPTNIKSTQSVGKRLVSEEHFDRDRITQVKYTPSGRLKTTEPSDTKPTHSVFKSKSFQQTQKEDHIRFSQGSDTDENSEEPRPSTSTPEKKDSKKEKKDSDKKKKESKENETENKSKESSYSTYNGHYK